MNEQKIRSATEYIAALLLHINKGAPKPEKPEELSWVEVYKFAKSQSLASSVYSAIESEVKSEAPRELVDLWDKERATDLAKHLKQSSEFSRLTAKLTEAKINFLPLKGFAYKALWKNPAHRTMSDLDIYFSPEDIERVGVLLSELGFAYEGACDVHLTYVKKPFLAVEVHRKFEENGKSPTFDTWQTKEGNPYWHIMNHEQFLTFNTLHAYKHYEGGGCGMRTVFDLYLYKNAYHGEIDWQALEKSLAEEGLSEFFRLLSELAEYWFDGKSPSEGLLAEAYYIATGGTYGTHENRVSYGVKSKGKLRYILSRVFPPYKRMKLRYPILKKLPILLPVMYIVRFVASIFNGRNSAELRDIKKHEDSNNK